MSTGDNTSPSESLDVSGIIAQFEQYLESNSGASATEINDWLSQQIDQTYFGGTGGIQSLAEQYGINGDPGEAEPVAPVGAVAFAAPPANGGLLNPPVVPQADPDAFPDDAPAALKSAPLTRPKGVPKKFLKYTVWEDFEWDGMNTHTLRSVDGNFEGLFNYEQRVFSHKTGHSEQKFEYIDAGEHAQAQSDLAAKQAELPVLQSAADALSAEAQNLATLCNILGVNAVKWGIIAAIPGVGWGFIAISGVYAGASYAASQAATLKSTEASSAQQQVHNCELEIQSFKDKVETGQGLTWYESVVEYDRIDDYRPPQSMGIVGIWQPTDAPYGLTSYAALIFGGVNMGSPFIGPQEVGEYADHTLIPAPYRQYVPQ